MVLLKETPEVFSFAREADSTIPLTFLQKSAIIVMVELGFDIPSICKKIRCSKDTVKKWIKTFKETSSLEHEARSGRPPATSTIEDASIVTLAEVNPFTTPKRIKTELELSVSARTIRRRLDAAGLLGRIARTEYQLSEDQIQARLEFAVSFREWLIKDWNKVLFVDETHVWLGHNGRLWVQRPEDAAFEEEYVKPGTATHTKVSIWAAFSSSGPGPFVSIDGTMNSKLLQNIFEDKLLPFAKSHWGKEPWYLLMDNAPYHRADNIERWIERKMVLKIKLPPYSPDLNPIENLWSDFKRRIEAHFATTAEELKKAIEIEWPATSTLTCQHLAQSMVHRMEAVIEAHGHRTHY